MICTYCGKERGNEYFCLNCKDPKEFISENGRVVTKEQVQKDVAKLIEYCQDMLYPEAYKFTHKIIEAAAMAGILGTTVYIRTVVGLVKEILEMQSFAGLTFKSMFF